MGGINREDMMELTRRMTVRRNCFSRIAGAYLNADGFVDGTFNRHFLKLSPKDRQVNLEIAKKVPFAKTNVNLKEFEFSQEDEGAGSVWQLLMALRQCELKNDALLDTFYEMTGERYRAKGDYAVCFFFGSYDVPLKASDKESLWESEEVYSFLICVICQVHGDYELGEAECGFLFPAFKDRSSDEHRIYIFQADASHPHTELQEMMFMK